MKSTLINLVITLNIIISFSSCKGQDQAKQMNQSKLGEIASSLEDKTWNIFQDQKGNYWFGSNGKGVFHYDGKTLMQYTTKDGLVGDAIRGIQGDHLGNVYISAPEGISKFDGFSFTTLKPITSASNEWKLEPNDLWFNCNGMPNDIYRYDGEQLFELKLPRKDLKKAFGGEVYGLGFKGMNSSPYSVFGINKDKKGNLWIGTIVAGAYRYDGKNFLWVGEKELTTLPDGRVPGVRSMIEDKDENMWLSNFISKYKIIEKDSNITYEKLQGVDMSQGQFDDRLPYFNSGLSDINGDLWMTTYTRGIWNYDGKKLYNFPLFDSETEALIVSIYQDNKGLFWIGTDNVGVFTFNGENFKKFSPTTGLQY